MGLKLEGNLALCPLGKFRVYSSGNYCFDDHASMECLSCPLGLYENGPNLFEVCKAPDGMNKEKLLQIISEYKETKRTFSPHEFQKFLTEKGYVLE